MCITSYAYVCIASLSVVLDIQNSRFIYCVYSRSQSFSHLVSQPITLTVAVAVSQISQSKLELLFPLKIDVYCVHVTWSQLNK